MRAFLNVHKKNNITIGYIEVLPTDIDETIFPKLTSVTGDSTDAIQDKIKKDYPKINIIKVNYK